MRWKSYRIMELPSDQQTAALFDTLTLIDSGYVGNYSINNDYMLKENSTMDFVGTTTTRAGDLVAIINDGVEVSSGVVVSVDNEQHIITYNKLLTLFDTEVINTHRIDKLNGILVVYEPVEKLVEQITLAFGSKSVDRRRRLPLRIITNGKAGFASWDFDDTFNMYDWVLELFDKFNVVIQASLVFENRLAYVRLRIFVNDKNQDIIKINVASLSITHSEVAKPSATVCQIQEKDTKELLQAFYLTIDGDVVKEQNNAKRFELYRLVMADYVSKIQDEKINDKGESELVWQTDDTGKPILDNNGNKIPVMVDNWKISQLQTAQSKLNYSEYSHYVTITAPKDSKLIDNLEIGDKIIIVHKVFETQQGDSLEDDDETKEKYILSSIYTGRQEDSTSNIITLMFGKIRVKYSELIELRNLQI